MRVDRPSIDSYRTWVDQLSASELVRVHQARAAEVRSLFREARRTINDIHRRGLQRKVDSADSSILYANDELADPHVLYPVPALDQLPYQSNSPNGGKPDQTNPNDSQQPHNATLCPAQEIAVARVLSGYCAEQPDHYGPPAEHSDATAAGYPYPRLTNGV